ncbi:uracil-DNA glycosylase [Paludibacterium purpuratum]|uniref:Uracil-DNA glycosylase n=1 Tax=Paludibacterium purpuratum TaxID=1144873 RepID=A0A4R7B0B2_9NEIS|nr:uracil-DNA glycosylase [Paludibacterium purpuratum]TDR72485.1 uracil-DNA glycosylase [Paludibacterium purpuratum]
MSSYSFLADALQSVHPGWLPTLNQENVRAALLELDRQLSELQSCGTEIYPPRQAIFRALEFCAPEQVRVVILGQDPYHGTGEAMGLSFSVPDSVRIPPSLRNIYKELARDTGFTLPAHGDLTPWAKQGVLLLNSVMTVEADKAGSHGRLGWQTVSNALINTVNAQNPGCVFMLWGNWARSNADKIDQRRHLVLEAVHPSPLSASRGFMQCGHFSKANDWLRQHGAAPLQWNLDSLV